MENSKVRLAHCASWCHVSRPGAVGFVLDRGLIPPFLLPPQGENLKRGAMFMMDGKLFFIIFFFKGKHHRALDGRDPNRDVCDVMRQTGTYFSHVEMSGRRVLVGRTVPSLSWVKEGFTGESCRDRGADQAPWSRVLCSLFRPQKFIYAVRNPTQFIQSFYFGRVLVLLLIKNWP